MKKIYTSLFVMGLLSGSAMAQQLPNADFEGGWVDCIPWNTANTTDKQGTTPASWCVSNVVTPKMNLGNATIANNIEGNNSTSAVQVFNHSAAGQVIPGYLTLGTTWSTAKIKLASPSDEDGGTWGGLDFTYRPDAISFDYIHSNGSGSTQPASAIVYLWKGETQQANVPGANSYSANIFGSVPDPATCTMVNRDRNIVGLSTVKGGDVTKSDDFETIAYTSYSINETPQEWTNLLIPIDYSSTATPSKINVIFAACDYFADRSNHKGNDKLSIDNVKLVYYSRLSGIKVNGVAVENFSPDQYSYTLSGDAPAATAFETTCLGNSGSASASVTVNGNVATIKVTNINTNGTDIDGETEHIYTVTFVKEAPTVVSSKQYTGLLTIDLGEVSEIPNTTITLNTMSDGTFAMSLEKFGADPTDPDDNGMGDINVDNITLDGTTLSGSAKGLELMGGYIKANVDLTGTLEDPDLTLNLDVHWLAEDGESIQASFPVTFTTKTSNVVDSKEYVGLLIIDLGEKTEIPNTTITLSTMKDGTYAMSLEKFGADPTDPEDNGMGDINVDNITLEGTTLTGSAKGLELMSGFIKADVDLTGTLDGEKLILHLTVKWLADDGETVQATFPVDFYCPAELAEEPNGLTYRRKYTDGSSRYYSEISYTVGDNTVVVYNTSNPTSEDYYVTPLQNQWQEEGAYIDFTDKVIEIPVDADQFTVTLKGLAGTAINWSQSCVYVDWNNNGSFIDEGETNGVINLGIKPNQTGGGLVITESGDHDDISLPAGLAVGDTFPMLIALTEPKGVDGTEDLWGSNWEWSKEIFNNNVCSLINGQAYELTVRIVDKLAAIDNVATDNNNAPVEFFNLQGMSVDADNLTPGIYIMRQGKNVKKVLVK